MKTTTKQKQFWISQFGSAYLKRNPLTVAELDKNYKMKFNVLRTTMNKEFLGKLPKDIKILEVGANWGLQLMTLQKLGFKNLYGIEVNPFAIEYAHKHTKGIYIIEGDALELPFKDGYFDLVFTSGVLIHIDPKNVPQAMKEIYRVSKKYIWGTEYHSDEYTHTPYRGRNNVQWKTNFPKIYMDLFPDLKLVKEKRYKYLQNENIDTMFLLQKSNKLSSGK
ncbi:MAG: pseudaminic acid biosynthesis-associated methylase [Patescibacteria group bacterium]